MKHWKLALVLGCTGFMGLHAQQVVRKAAVPPAVVEEFEYRFADAENVVWLQDGSTYYGARFNVNGQPTEAVYTPGGDWVQTEQEIGYRELPDSARNYSRAYYPDYQVGKVMRVSTRKAGILYELKVRSGLKQVSMTFNMHGKLVAENEEEIAAQPTEESKGAQVGSPKTGLGKVFKREQSEDQR